MNINSNTNLPPRMRHKFKLRNPKILHQNSSSQDEFEMMTNNLLKLQRQMTEQYQSATTEDEIKYDDKQNVYSSNKDDDENEHGYEEQEYKKQQQLYITNKSHSQKYTQQVNLQDKCSQIHTVRNQHLQQQGEQQNSFNNNNKYTIKQSLQKAYQQYLSSHQSLSSSKNYQQKINELLDTEQEIMTVGNTISLFQMVYYFKEILTKEVLMEIQFKAFQSVLKVGQLSKQIERQGQSNNDNLNEQEDQFKDQQKQLLQILYAELISICGIPSQQIVNYYLHQIISNPPSFQHSFKVLINMGFLGISALTKIINQDFEQLSQKVLKKLSKTDFIISQIIVPQVYSDLIAVSSSIKDKNTALFLLSKIGQIAYSKQRLEILLSLFKSNCIDKHLLISAIISTCKQHGQKILINLLQQPAINQDIAIFIIKCLSIPSDTHKKMKLNIEICEYSVVDLLQLNKLYFYEGQVKQLFVCEDNLNKDTLFVNSRMLVSLIEKLLIDEMESQEYEYDNKFVKQTQCLKSFILPQIITKQDEKQPLPNLQVINIFLMLLQRIKQKQKTKTKIALIQALGNITLPQDLTQIIQKLTPYLFSSDPSILSITCLTLRKLEFIPSMKIILRLNELLKHNLWKVRISACQAVSSLLRQPVDKVLQTLIKCLKDGSINRQLVCQTLLKIHPVCEELLIEILKSSKDTRIQEIILCSFNQKQILFSDNFLMILEAIYDFSKNKRKQIRYICLGVVNSLRKLSIEEQLDLGPFKDKNILPFYYNFLSDPCSQIREMALNLILEFGNYAELILIEGMTKGRVNCKIECAKGLGQRGVQNFRALLLGMRDMNEKVRQQCCSSILQNFEVQQIVDQFQDQQSQCVSLVYNIKDLIQTTHELHPQIKIFLAQLMGRLLQNIKDFKFEPIDQDQQIEKQINNFRESMRLRKQGQQSLSTNFQQQNQDTENTDPNIFVQKNNMKNVRYRQNTIQSQHKSTQKTKSNHQKRYYFRLNEAIEN